jgi:hypothetical protein
MLIYTNGNNTGNGTGYEAFLYAVDRSTDHAIARFAITTTAATVIVIICLIIAALNRRKRG